MIGQMHVLRPGTGFASAFLSLIPLIAAALIAISRCEDYRHDVYDVTVGSLLGFLVAYFSYRRYYPPLRDPDCKTPYPSRSETAHNEGFERVDQDEGHVVSAGGYAVDDEGEDLEARSDENHRDLEMGRM
jgi:diacylglycerol diphosphate phosphatase / phosphatidate phosphatase